MRRVICILCTVLLVAAGLGSDSPKEYGDATELNDYEGEWRVVANTDGGRHVFFGGLGIQTNRGGKWVYTLDGRLLYEGVYTADNRSNPATLDETDTAGAYKRRTRKFIYQTDGHTMRMAFNRNDPLTRPKSFADDELFIITWERVKK